MSLTEQGLRDTIRGMAEVMVSLAAIERKSQEAMSAAENELNAVRKVRGWLRIAIDQHQEALRVMMEEK
jgi:hypothetical protein